MKLNKRQRWISVDRYPSIELSEIYGSREFLNGPISNVVSEKWNTM